MKADTQTEAAVKAVLNKMAESYAKRDVEALLALMAPDPDHVMFGTQADEKRIGRAAIRAQAARDWSQTEAASMGLGWTSVSAAGNIAWVAADMTFKVKAGGQDMALPGRMTAVLEKRGEKWLFVQSHFSLPAAGQGGESFPSGG